jgi:molybdopterin-guanine dinucleotide biosynthesis protein A
VLLAGGKGSRLGGVDKPALLLDGRTLLDRALEAVGDADPVVVVGPRRPTARSVCWTREEPPGSGPVAALAAGLAELGPVPGVVALLAADLAAVTPGTVQRLCDALAAAPHAAGALLVDDGGSAQWLLGVWWADALRAAAQGIEPGGSLRSVLGPLDAVRVPERAGESADIDTESDLRAAGGSAS